MKKQLLFVNVIFYLFMISFVSASCSDVDIEITGINMKYNFMEGQINSGETEIKEIKIYLDGEPKMLDKREEFRKDILFPSFRKALSMGQEIRLDIILNDGTVCESKEILTVSEEKEMILVLECDSKDKREDWCVDDQVWGTKCEDGGWIEFIDVDCSYWGGTCKGSKCVESENENNILLLTELDKSSTQITNLNTESEPQESELIQTQLEEKSPTNPIRIIFDWIVNIFT